jgi:fibro-slime domain-containing protein
VRFPSLCENLEAPGRPPVCSQPVLRAPAPLLLTLLIVVGCGLPAGDDFVRGGALSSSDPPSSEVQESILLRAVIRDFRADHPDFEAFGGSTPTTGLVLPELGEHGRPVHAHDGPTDQTSGPEFFDQWYRHVPGVNETFVVALPLHRDEEGSWVFDDSTFFPIDGLGTPEEEQDHNFHFTTAIQTRFEYRGGERFTFVGDDDLWLFLNGRLALDLGGLHEACAGSVDLDAVAGELGLQPGGTYPMHLFHAERHTTESSFRLETTIEALPVAD